MTGGQHVRSRTVYSEGVQDLLRGDKMTGHLSIPRVYFYHAATLVCVRQVHITKGLGHTEAIPGVRSCGVKPRARAVLTAQHSQQLSSETVGTSA